MGYHKRAIPRGKYGDLSKITEELHELLDAEHQMVKVLQLVELSDLYGVIEGYLEKNFPGMTMEDVKKMSNLTKSAFRDGSRKSRVEELAIHNGNYDHDSDDEDDDYNNPNGMSR